MAILRDGHVRVPRGSSALEAADELVVLATPQAYAKLTGQPLEDTPNDPPAPPSTPTPLERLKALWSRMTVREARQEKVTDKLPDA
ncbi:MAG: hypothetical protein HC933_04625 [Pleurocapsa sp. SU_196_0]|nr:hypothetical protein [Pleurocapsa sp. SU_196_0]